MPCVGTNRTVHYSSYTSHNTARKTCIFASDANILGSLHPIAPFVGPTKLQMATRSHDRISATWTSAGTGTSISHYTALIKCFASNQALTWRIISSKGPFEVTFKGLPGYTQHRMEVRACPHNGECGDKAFIDVRTLPTRKCCLSFSSETRG